MGIYFELLKDEEERRFKLLSENVAGIINDDEFKLHPMPLELQGKRMNHDVRVKIIKGNKECGTVVVHSNKNPTFDELMRDKVVVTKKFESDEDKRIAIGATVALHDELIAYANNPVKEKKNLEQSFSLYCQQVDKYGTSGSQIKKAIKAYEKEKNDET